MLSNDTITTEPGAWWITTELSGLYNAFRCLAHCNITDLLCADSLSFCSWHTCGYIVIVHVL